MHFTVKIEKMATYNKIELTTKDHWVVGIHSVLIWISIKFAFTPNLFISMIGWAWVYLNFISFEAYGLKRVQEMKK